ncbi:fluoride efflux transporter CrcB [Castellaniella sp.]|uniref:fluoride efflux transporter CrcB n=1 Tax=Castellaniella sp. TaxID=1955812 RepID=UPI002AFE4438|nr:fluoride efflux transporter CrcB [Castellaniella sp.]
MLDPKHLQDMGLTGMLWVGLGGGFGSLLRWQVGKLVGERYQGNFPLATFLVNISGAFVFGYLSIYFAVSWQDRAGDALNTAILTGVLGGYTTFSTLMLDVLKLNGGNQRKLAQAYLAASVVLGLMAAWLGALLAY